MGFSTPLILYVIPDTYNESSGIVEILRWYSQASGSAAYSLLIATSFRLPLLFTWKGSLHSAIVPVQSPPILDQERGALVLVNHFC